MNTLTSNEHTKRVVAAARRAIEGKRIAVGSPLHLLEMFIKIVEERTPETEATRVARSLRDSANGCLENDMVAYTPTALRAIADRIDGGNAQKASE